ncbi:V-type ATP synthase subunit E [Methermicoccus shengliensis]|uniref:A-type ATP synthase subunit E n=1 Tax=Methermicoccus shengliensis TaxID=660064 RepID=A0A832RV63_9EURY|nr:V-type ATP synthase subunit E family protein [Methermicoccus shengliensis]KUK05086.1 MAG: V-type ATP synthase subunit E [Euryarchaeota archaeon 55_53]KUK30379.1 MAG: V-type ATP synthase subunit E [Methanosarcinales archeaon 56_1174]MDI3487530.1 V/A-type H+/Na+-transporting ATPase subunit [Methanosarcinales archaeon]MDN5294679.1 V/A-type H+/Na+-transporting ATPase subunit [Methanosarcinales archaeon]HIH69390.1 hypothetical protein [Methermicoccus shengliensis]
MGLTEIIEDIEQETQQRRAKILEEGKAQADAILKDAEREKEKLILSYEEEARRLAASERRERLSSARLDARRMIVEAREEVVQRAIHQLWDVLESLRDSPEYQEMLRRAIQQGVRELGGSATVYAAPHDLEKVKAIAAEFPSLVVSDEPLESRGGVVLVSPDGSVRFENTLESLVEEKMESIRLEVYNHIFGEER